ncbi:cobyrinic acid a,c-diamide synthase [Vulcanisaeta souniana JCM 11219]|nr:cobyrinate a,c-diamide synthase [Vulcanisaeta souniana]GGI77477.1 cobyrinic acid a,c-diamide synthase [Vulcanisaeta souniana JCM 11219]
MEATVPRLVIASYKGKNGKTTVTLALAYALIRTGYRISMFKVGPDYIDPSYHSVIINKPSRNLDYVLMGNRVITRFYRYSMDSDIAIIEGVSGLYDSMDGVTEVGSTAQVAKLLGAPVVLVINGERINRTVRAIIRGLRIFDPSVRIVGAVITNVNQRQLDKLRTAVENEGLEFLGYVPKRDDVEEVMQYRHLGLMHAGEVNTQQLMNVFRDASDFIDVNKVIKIAREYSEPIEVRDYASPNESKEVTTKLRVGILGGRVFTFYYPETIERISNFTRDLKFIDPERDQELGELDLLLIGGGFPEVYGEDLERNRSLRYEVRRFIDSGGYLYAECGGLMYLTNSIIHNNEEYDMVGAIDATTIMHRRPMWYGYAKARVIRDSIIGNTNTVLMGHEFHYSSLILHGNYDFVIKYERGVGVNGFDGFQINNAYAHYLHIHPDTYDVIDRILRRILVNKTKP